MESCSFWLWNFLYSFIFNWSIIALQCCVSFCYKTKWISYKYVCVCVCVCVYVLSPFSLGLSSCPSSHPYLFYFFWFTSLCMTDSSLQMTQLVPFHGRVTFHHAYVPYLFYPFICQWAFTLLPCLGHCKQCYYEHWYSCVFLTYVLGSFSIYILWYQFDFTIAFYMLLF